jgi:hypothetical protein
MSVGPGLTIAAKGTRGKDQSTMCWVTWSVSTTRVVTLPGNGHRELTTTWDHYHFALDRDYGTARE